MGSLNQEAFALYREKYKVLVAGKQGSEHLIPILKAIQDQEGYLPKEALVFVAESLHIPLGQVFGVATFYNFFKLEPSGKYKILLCDGTACHVKKAPLLLEALQKYLTIKPGEVSKDGKFSLEIVRCLGLCASAPVMMINEKVYPNVDVEHLKDILDEYQ